MIHTADLAALHTHLDAHPADWSARLVLADLLLDLGDDDEAACQRWMVEHWKHPRYETDHTIAVDYAWHWWHSMMSATGPHRLPYGVLRCMPPMMEWGTRLAAEAALRRALRAAGEI